MASLAATDFLGRGLHARTLRVDRYGYREGREREKEKEKGTLGYEKLYVTFK